MRFVRLAATAPKAGRDQGPGNWLQSKTLGFPWEDVSILPQPHASVDGGRLLWATPAGNTYLTDREKSPGALSLSRIRKAPSCLCLLSISSALALGILPKNHLRKESKPVNICFCTTQWAVQPHMQIRALSLSGEAALRLLVSGLLWSSAFLRDTLSSSFTHSRPRPPFRLREDLSKHAT